MAEQTPAVDPKYEVDAPRFFDFISQQADHDRGDSWFAEQPDGQFHFPIRWIVGRRAAPRH